MIQDKENNLQKKVVDKISLTRKKTAPSLSSKAVQNVQSIKFQNSVTNIHNTMCLNTASMYAPTPPHDSVVGARSEVPYILYTEIHYTRMDRSMLQVL
jgi:hypothetical protein